MGLEVGAVKLAESWKCRRPNLYKGAWAWPWGARSQPKGGVQAAAPAIDAGAIFCDVEWAWKLVQFGLRNRESADDPFLYKAKWAGGGRARLQL